MESALECTYTTLRKGVEWTLNISISSSQPEYYNTAYLQDLIHSTIQDLKNSTACAHMTSDSNECQFLFLQEEAPPEQGR